jgi:hypothetical protein
MFVRDARSTRMPVIADAPQYGRRYLLDEGDHAELCDRASQNVLEFRCVQPHRRDECLLHHFRRARVMRPGRSTRVEAHLLTSCGGVFLRQPRQFLGGEPGDVADAPAGVGDRVQ